MKVGVNLKLGIAYATTDQTDDEPSNPKSTASSILDDRHSSSNYRALYWKWCSYHSICFT